MRKIIAAVILSLAAAGIILGTGATGTHYAAVGSNGTHYFE